MSVSEQSHTLLVADIHLQPDSTHPINQAFIHFLENDARQADAVYILGDLFEMWVGDDIGLTEYQLEINALKQLHDSGVKLYGLYGNRDFLMGEAFWQASGIQLLADLSVITLYNLPIIVCHGDELCTDDSGYQRMRRLLRSAWIQQLFLWLPKKRRLAIGTAMRKGSQTSSQQKPMRYMDVTDRAVEALFNAYPNCNHLVHGHTHQPAHHQLTVNHQTKHRWVVGDWRPQAEIVKVNSDQTLALITLSTQ